MRKLQDVGLAQGVTVPDPIRIIEVETVVRLRRRVIVEIEIVIGELQQGRDLPAQFPLRVVALAPVHGHQGAIPVS